MEPTTRPSSTSDVPASPATTSRLHATGAIAAPMAASFREDKLALRATSLNEVDRSAVLDHQASPR